MIEPVIFTWQEWTPHKRGTIDNTTGSYKLRCGTIEVHGDRDVPDWVRQASPNEADLYRPRQPRLL